MLEIVTFILMCFSSIFGCLAISQLLIAVINNCNVFTEFQIVISHTTCYCKKNKYFPVAFYKVMYHCYPTHTIICGSVCVCPCVCSHSCYFATGCVRRWCPLKTLLSQRPPPHCRNGASCGSNSMWSVALYYSTSHSYQNKALSNKCETSQYFQGSWREKQHSKKICGIHCCFIFILLREFDGIGFSTMFFFFVPNSTPGLTRSASKSSEYPEIWPKHILTAPLDISPACRSDCHPTFSHTI